MAHGRDEAFDPDDRPHDADARRLRCYVFRHQRQHQTLMKQAKAAAAADMAHDLAHQINNPLQSLTNILYLAEAGQMGGDAKELAAELSEHLQRLSVLAGRLLSLPAALNKADIPGQPTDAVIVQTLLQQVDKIRDEVGQRVVDHDVPVEVADLVSRGEAVGSARTGLPEPGVM